MTHLLVDTSTQSSLSSLQLAGSLKQDAGRSRDSRLSCRFTPRPPASAESRTPGSAYIAPVCGSGDTKRA